MPRSIDRLWDSMPALRAAAKSSIATSPTMLGELTVSMLKGEHGHQRKEFGKLLDWLATEPAPDVVSLPNSLLISLAEPLKKALNRPVTCTLQGEDLFLEGLPEPYRSESLALIRRQIGEVDLFIAVSEYCAESMSTYLEIPRSKIRIVPLGVNLKGYEPNWKFQTNCFTVGYFARVCPEKGLHTLC
jgi:glycosyltransferase involved in cell wall biosynthesis